MAYLKEGDEIPTKGRGSKLRGKMLLFVEAYLADPDMVGANAVIAAGYKVRPGSDNHYKMAHELLNHPLVKKEVESRLADRREKAELTADYVLSKLVKIVEDTETGNPQAALRGLELLGRHLGLYKDRQEISGPDGEAIQMEQKVNERAADFTSKLSRLAQAGKEAGVVVPLRKGDAG